MSDEIDKPPQPLQFSQEEFEKLTSSITSNAIDMAREAVEERFDEFQIEGPNVSGSGTTWEINPMNEAFIDIGAPETAVEVQVSQVWDIQTNIEGEIYFRPGIIKLNTDYDKESKLEITDIDSTFTFPTADQVAYLDFEVTGDSNEITACTLKVGNRWSSWPSPYATEDNANNIPELTNYYALLWSFHDSDEADLDSDRERLNPERYPLSEDITAIRHIPDSSLLVAYNVQEMENVSNVLHRIEVLSLVPTIGALPGVPTAE